MAISQIILFICMTLRLSSSSVLIWGTEKLELPAIQHFSNSDFNSLVEKLDYPKIVAFNGPIIHDSLKDFVTQEKYSAYLPNGQLTLENATDLSGIESDDYIKIKNSIEDLHGNFLIVINKIDQRLKRDTEETNGTITEEPPQSPVLYKQEGIMIFSSKALLFKTNITSQYLHNTNLVTVDKRNAYSRLIVNIPTEGGKIALRFKFPWSNGYWSLTSVEIEDVDGTTYNLTLKQEVTAPKSFSYHCTGVTTFIDTKNLAELVLYNLQVQMDSKNGKFSDAYDCVPFTTAPIWSGLFVTFILTIGLFIALNAISTIKTMDKFDNQKTKQLCITVSE